MEKHDLQQVIDRCGKDYVAKRLQIQVEHSAQALGPGLGGFHFENLEWLLNAFGWIVKLFRGWDKGFSNIKDHKIVLTGLLFVTFLMLSMDLRSFIYLICIWMFPREWALT